MERHVLKERARDHQPILHITANLDSQPGLPDKVYGFVDLKNGMIYPERQRGWTERYPPSFLSVDNRNWLMEWVLRL